MILRYFLRRDRNEHQVPDSGQCHTFFSHLAASVPVLARTCGRRAADMIENVGSSQYTFIIPHTVTG